MQALGLYVSTPRSPQETDRPFAEPGLFLINPDGPGTSRRNLGWDGGESPRADHLQGDKTHDQTSHLRCRLRTCRLRWTGWGTDPAAAPMQPGQRVQLGPMMGERSVR